MKTDTANLVRRAAAVLATTPSSETHGEFETLLLQASTTPLELSDDDARTVVAACCATAPAAYFSDAAMLFASTALGFDRLRALLPQQWLLVACNCMGGPGFHACLREAGYGPELESQPVRRTVLPGFEAFIQDNGE